MKFKVDENLPIDVAKRLNQAGHDSLTVLQQQLGGAKDNKLARVCKAEERIIITLDLDFADIRAYPPHKFAGFIVLRLKQQDRPHVMQIIEGLVKALEKDNPEQKLWIVDERRIRIRE